MTLINKRLAKSILESLIDGGKYSLEYFIIEFVTPSNFSIYDLNEVLSHLEAEEKIQKFTLTTPITGFLTMYYEATSTI